MSPAFQRGNNAVDALLGSGSSALLTRRVEAHRQGGVVWSLETAAGPRWLKLANGALGEIQPRQDDLLPGASSIEESFDAPLEVLSWRPGRRIVQRGTRRGIPLVVKGYRRGRSLDAARRHALVAEHAATHRLRTARLVEHDEVRSCLIFERLSGEPPRLGRHATRTFYRIGDALRRFQSVPAPSDLVRHDRRSELDVLDRLAHKVEGLSGALPVHYAALRMALEDYAASAVPDGVLLHGDLHDGQILENGNELAWIDFDSLRVGEPALDVANLTAHLTLRGLQRVRDATGAAAAAAAGALLDGYDGPADAAFTQSLRFHQVSTFLRLGLLYSLRPRWSGLPSVLLTLAQKCLDDVLRVS